MAINKIVLNTDSGEQVLVDLTGDNVTADSLVVGSVAHGADGEIVQGANPYELNTTNAEVGTQTDLIAQISAALAGKATPSAGKPEQEKTLDATENDTYEVVPDDGYTLSKVTVHVDVPTGGGDSEEFISLLSGSIKTLDNDSITKLRAHACDSCTSLLNVDLPNVTSVGIYAFYACSKLQTVKMPSLETVNNYCFQTCTALTTVDLTEVSRINNSAFQGCSKLTALILRGSTVCSLGVNNAFNNTPIKSGTGYVYCRRSLLSQYQSATNWSALPNYRALEDYTVDGTITGELDPSKI